MAINPASLKLITDFEGFIDHWYPDAAYGWKVPTCCYGHTNAAGEPNYASTKDKKFTKAEGEAILARDLKDYEAFVDQYVTVKLNDNQRGALVSFTYNCGPANLKKSTLLKKVNAGDFAGAAGEFARWNKAAGKVMAGLTRRRAAEAALFSTPVGKGDKVDVWAPEPEEKSRSMGLIGWAIVGLLVLAAIAYVITRPVIGV